VRPFSSRLDNGSFDLVRIGLNLGHVMFKVRWDLRSVWFG